ncbi:RND superfamily putative drug exporter [Scopulibacillus daqui]|uniref:RND superfamily putative drug exporter n=1 Tax=Scopulibacillus daqui TaxID=1469162 RepID=A0ABS2Q088_9BACL|nr:MMPL family transporter [Scopulibacillus daqui]MBM7645710.1 RND superfamily putative drug exporter [Scopulibacillus daqui]
MKYILKGKWAVFAIWIIAIAALLFLAPNMAKLVQEKGQATVPEGYSSTKAAKIIDEMNKQKGRQKTSSATLAFYNEHGLTKKDKEDIKHAISELKEKKNQLGITQITNPFDQPSLQSQLISKNGKTLLVSLNINTNGKNKEKLTNDLYKTIDDIRVDHYYTSDWMVNNDMMTSTQKGLHKTEWITVIFILAVLLIVFRSIVAPLIPLITVGVSFLASQSIVSFLVDWADFPISNFTQIFLVAVLFGVGTDYCILLLNRFKEELPKHETVNDAIISTYKHAGKTVFFSGLAVLIGFSAIGLSQFSIYKSAAGVAVGIFVLLIALVTIVPFFMSVLGKKIFWPAKGSLEHKQSKLWDRAGRFALARTLIAFVIVLIITVPFLIKYDGHLSFNTLDELGDQYKSVKGFHIISDNFNPGESMPTKIAIKNDDKMDGREPLQTIEAITREVKKVDGVETVRSVTQPMGKPVKDFLVPNQAQTLSDGLSQANQAINKISSGLKGADSSIMKSGPQLNQATGGVDELINGTSALKNGISRLSDSMSQLQKGLETGSASAKQLQSGIKQSVQGARQLQSQSQQLLNGYEQIGNSISDINNQINKSYQDIQPYLNKVDSGVSVISDRFNSLENKYPEIKNDANFEIISQALPQVKSTMSQLENHLKQLSSGMNTLSEKMNEANSHFAQLIDGQKTVTSSLGRLADGMGQLEQGIQSAASGQTQINRKLPDLENGASSIQQGQEKLKEGFSQFNGQIGQLSSGLNNSAKGLDKVSKGLQSANDFLNELSASNSSLSGFYIPDQALKSNQFKNALDTYMSKDRKITTIDVIFKYNPYSTEAMDQIDKIKSAVKRAAKGTQLENAEVGISGITSTNNDLRTISHKDYTRTATLMLIGIGLILIILLRSLIMPVYIIASLILTYFTSLGLSEIIFENILGYSGLSWAVPFFAFVMLIALGVDYSIFIMDRFNEYFDLPIREAIIEAMRNMGTVIMSAALILGGTFAAMMPSGVLTLIEIAVIIIIGLILYNLVILPLFIPIMVKTFGKANWWPFRRSETMRHHHED